MTKAQSWQPLAEENLKEIRERFATIFPVEDFGDLADSHLRFFTPRRGADLLHRCGLEIRHSAHTSLITPAARTLVQIGRTAARMWPAGLALSTIYFARTPRA